MAIEMLSVVLYLVVSSNVINGRLIESKPRETKRHYVIYVSKHRGNAKSDSCGNMSLPCKTLQVGIDKLASGGQLFVDGEHTSEDPYTCESSGRILTAERSLSIQSYTTPAHISCANGFHILANEWNMNVTVMRVRFHKTSLFLKDTSLAIKDCVFTASSYPAISVNISNSLSFFSLDIQNAVFRRNLGCIQVVEEGSSCCKRIIMSLRDTLFINNATPTKSGTESNGLILVRNNNCNSCSQEMSLFSMWKNVTMLNNKDSSIYYDHKKHDGEHKYYFRKTYRQNTKTIFAVEACLVHLTFSKVITMNNVNIRFLALQSQQSTVRIENSSYQGHHLDQPGGVLYINDIDTTGVYVNVYIADSMFTYNSGTKGGVLQVDDAKDKNVTIYMKNVNISHSYGSDVGCLVSIGRVARIFAKLEGLKVEKCNHPSSCKTKECIHNPLIFLQAKQTIKIDIENSIFQQNNNRALLIDHAGDERTTGCTLIVQMSNTRFMENNTTGSSVVKIHVSLSSPAQMEKSILNISKSDFLRNSGVAILALQLKEIYISNFTCKATSWICLQFDAINLRSKRIQSPINSTLRIDHSKFTENGTPLTFRNSKPLFVNISIMNTVIDNNYFSRNALMIRVGHRDIRNTLISGTLLMENVYFTSNYVQRAHGSVLGVIVFRNSGNFTTVVRNSIFKSNSHKKSKKSRAFINLFYINIPHIALKNGSANTYRDPNDTCPKYQYRNKITFDNVTFINNTAITSTLFINSGNASFHKCLFKDNFSFQPGIGAHLYFGNGATSGNFYDTKFVQTRKDPGEHLKLRTLSSLLFIEAEGPVEMRNTSFTLDLFIIHTIPMFILQRGHSVHFDDETTFSCPVGSFLKLYNATYQLSSDLLTEDDCVKMTVIRLLLKCRMCPINKYTLQSGSLRGMQQRLYINCFDCPFGAQCDDNIKSRPNYWGYKISEHPPQLKFEKCPEGYCRHPEATTNLSIYNKCAGNRNGTMCGECNEGFTESMFNHHCRPINDCRDRWFWAIAATYSVIMAIFVLCQPSLILFLINKVLWFKEKKSSIPSSRVERMNKSHNHDGHAYFKITCYFYQVAELLMLESTSEILPKVSLLSSIISFYNFEINLADSSFGCPFQGLTAVTKELFRCLHVFATMLVIVVFYFLHCFKSFIWKNPRPSFAHYLAAIIEVLLLGYERLGETSLKLLNCTPLDLLGKVEWRLVLDGNITCWIHWWQYLMIAYNIVFVIPFMLVLLVGTRKLKRQKISAWHFVAACFVPLPFLVYWILRRYFSCDVGVSEDPNPSEEEKRNSLLEVLEGPFRPPDIQSRGALYWESILIGRRLVLLCLFSFVSSLLPRLLCMTLVCMLILIHSAIFMPYKDRKANVFALFLLTMHVVMATINLSESVLITAGVTFGGPLKSQMEGCRMFEIFLLSVLPCAFVLLLVLVFVSQAMRLFLIFCRYFLKDIDAKSRHTSHQPLMTPVGHIPPD